MLVAVESEEIHDSEKDSSLPNANERAVPININININKEAEMLRFKPLVIVLDENGFLPIN